MNEHSLVHMTNQTSKRTSDEASSNADEEIEDISINKRFKHAILLTGSIGKSIFQDLCTDIFLELFQYLRPVDLLYSFTGLYPHLDALVEPYTHTLDFRLMCKSYFHCLTQSILPCLTNNLRVLRLSNAHTFSQISEIFYKLDWSRINQLESLTFDSIKSDELAKYFLDIHPLLKHLWRLSFTFENDDQSTDKLLINHILIPTNQSQSLTNCFITGITFDLSKSIGQKSNEYLRELTITLSTINDLIILFRTAPRLEILTCTIIHSTCSESIDKISSLDYLSTLTLTIDKPIVFKNLQKILIPHVKLKRLTLKAILCDENSSSSSNSNQEIGGLVLEKLFRTFSQLTKLSFYLRHLQNDSMNTKPDYLYLFSFTSHFWRDRSIQVFTHFVLHPKQRYIYTLPFAFDTFDIVDDINTFFSPSYPYYFPNVRHLSFSSTIFSHDFTDLNKILKFFPNIQTITFLDELSFGFTDIDLNKHQWILQKSSANPFSTDAFPRIYILNGRKSSHLYFQTLDITNEDQRLFANNSKRVRQLTISEMTEQQTVNLTYFFPWIHVLTLYVNTLDWFSSSNDWFYHLLTHMTSLFSLTVYYPKNLNDEKIRDLLANTLLAIKNHFFIKCNHGILNIWF